MSFIHGSDFSTSSVHQVQLHEIPRTKFLDAMLNHSPVHFTLHFGPKFFLNASIASEAFDSSYQLKRPLMACNVQSTAKFIQSNWGASIKIASQIMMDIDFQKCFRNSKHLLRFFFSISLVALSSLGDREGFGVGDGLGCRRTPSAPVTFTLLAHLSVQHQDTFFGAFRSSLRGSELVSACNQLSRLASVSFASFTTADIVSLSCFASLSHVTALQLAQLFFTGSWVPSLAVLFKGPWVRAPGCFTFFSLSF